jgi:hypothetical protein
MRRRYEGKDSAIPTGGVLGAVCGEHAAWLFGETEGYSFWKPAKAIVPICKYWEGLNRVSLIMNEEIHE